MKKRILLFVLFLIAHAAFSQNEDIDVQLKKIAAEKNDSARIVLINNYFPDNLSEINPVLDMQYGQKLLLQAQQTHDGISEAMALSGLGYDYRSLGNNTKSLEYDLKAVATAEKTGNKDVIGIAKFTLGHNYKDEANYAKAIRLYSASGAIGYNLNDYYLQTEAMGNLGEIYLSSGKIDSALTCEQRAYEIATQHKVYSEMYYILQDLGTIHGLMGNSALAISYFNLAVKEGLRINSPKVLNHAYTAIAQYYHTNNQNDSALVYAKKAIIVVQHTAFSNMSIMAAKLLADFYRTKSADSTVKYLDIYMSAKDSLFSERTIQQSQAMIFEDDLRQQQIALGKAQTAEQQKENIQYVLIALGIVTIIILYLLLSRSFITNTKLIEFFGVVALLIVFEFLNLILHPFLERLTNHSPLLMLLGLVCIAALLVPMHNRIEKWATHKLVEKNKQIRLAAAKKTIEQLEKEKNN